MSQSYDHSVLQAILHANVALQTRADLYRAAIRKVHKPACISTKQALLETDEQQARKANVYVHMSRRKKKIAQV